MNEDVGAADPNERTHGALPIGVLQPAEAGACAGHQVYVAVEIEVNGCHGNRAFNGDRVFEAELRLERLSGASNDQDRQAPGERELHGLFVLMRGTGTPARPGGLQQAHQHHPSVDEPADRTDGSQG